jgi:hypothetical protein
LPVTRTTGNHQRPCSFVVISPPQPEELAAPKVSRDEDREGVGQIMLAQ